MVNKNNDFMRKTSLREIASGFPLDYKKQLKERGITYEANEMQFYSPNYPELFRHTYIEKPEENKLTLREARVFEGRRYCGPIVSLGEEAFSIVLGSGISLESLLDLELSPHVQYKESQIITEDQADKSYLISLFSYMIRTDVSPESLHTIDKLLTLTHEGCRQYLKDFFGIVNSPPINLTRELISSRSYGVMSGSSSKSSFDGRGNYTGGDVSSIHSVFYNSSADIITGLVKAEVCSLK